MRRCCCRRSARWTTPPSVEAIPLNKVSVSVAVIHDVATVLLRHCFLNDTDTALEVDYTFPTPSDAALASLKVFSEGNVIEGVVKEKEEAREEFSDALANGDQPYMLELGDSTVNLHIGVLSPRCEVTVEVAYVVEVKFSEGRWKMMLPRNLVVAHSSKGVMAPKGPLPQWDFECRVETNSAVKELLCSVPSEYEALSDCAAILKSSASVFPYQDVEISYTTEDPSAPYFVMQRDPRTGALGCHISFMPTEVVASLDSYDPSGEFILMLDRSGSMKGKALEKAKEAAELFIRSLPEKSLFNVVSFGTSFELLFASSVAYTEASINEAIATLETFEADLGGTNIYSPLQKVIGTEPSSSFPRYVFLITDGEVDNPKQVVELVERNHQNTRVSCVGIGKSASSKLLKQIAEAGQGSSEIIFLNGCIAQGVLQSLSRAIKPAITDIDLKWTRGLPIVQHPARSFYAFSGERISFNAILDEGVSDVVFSLNYLDNFTQELKVHEGILSPSQATEGFQTIVQAVRGSFGTSDEARMSVRYQVLAKSTSMLAVNRTQEKAGAPAHLVSIVGMTRQNVARFKAKTSQLRSKRGRGRPSRPSYMEEASEEQSYRDRSRSASACSDSVSVANEALLSKQHKKRARVPISSSFESTKFIQLQSLAGYWTPSSALEALLAKANLNLLSAMQKFSDIEAAVLMTAIVVALLEERFNEEAGVWGLVVQKARRWLMKENAMHLLVGESGLLAAASLIRS